MSGAVSLDTANSKSENHARNNDEGNLTARRWGQRT